MKKSFALASLALGVVVAGGGFAVAATTIPDGQGAIHACYATSTGSVRVVSGSTCKAGEKSLTWNTRGVAGPAGPAGTAGADGKDGKDGKDGAAGPAGPAGQIGATGPEGPAGKAGATGPTGPQGPQGPAGKDGKDGKTGPAGTTEAQLVTGPAVTIAAGDADEADVTCPTGTFVIGTGVRNRTPGNGIQTNLYINDLEISPDRTSVSAFARNTRPATEDNPTTVAAQAICAA